MLSTASHSFRNAPQIILGAFFLFALSSLTSCKKEDQNTSVSEVEETPNSAETASNATEPEQENTPRSKVAAEGETRFLSFNIKNYLTMERYIRGGGRQTSSKPEKEISALIAQIITEKPDVLGLCEIGTMDDLLDLQSRLKKAGLDLPHLEHAGGADPTRRLAVLSRLPITARNSADDLPYELEGQEFKMSRGILDVTIDLPGGPTHFIGVHLKSKREIEGADQAMMRLNEAMHLRKHCDAILKENSQARLIVYGDMNETKGNAPIKAIHGNQKSDEFLDDVWAKDSRGEVWTHYWSYQQQYARFDYVFFSRAMKPEMRFKKCYIVDPINFFDASDHRAIMVTIGKE
ncbi:MAG: endonuclease/exonuclease/phosphatase family protein [Akkermansiaceae bacterium]